MGGARRRPGTTDALAEPDGGALLSAPTPPPLVMRRTAPAALVVALALVAWLGRPAPPEGASRGAAPLPVEPVNAVVGDAGFEAVFGRRPDAADGEGLRIRTHLAYVEGALRARDVSALAPEARAARLRLLDTLAAYRRAGVFPRNAVAPGRTPVFIDGDGRVCAVGRLVEASAGRGAAERVAAAHRLDRIAEMTAAVGPWAAAHGFTLAELAAIQPTYCGPEWEGAGWNCHDPEPADETLSEGVEIAALAAGGLAAGLNLGLLARGERSRVVGGASAVLGGGLLYLGLSGRGSWDRVDAAVGGAALAAGLLQALRPAPRPGAPRLDLVALPGREPTVRLSARWAL